MPIHVKYVHNIGSSKIQLNLNGLESKSLIFSNGYLYFLPIFRVTGLSELQLQADNFAIDMLDVTDSEQSEC
jgi:hypothetical protein